MSSAGTGAAHPGFGMGDFGMEALAEFWTQAGKSAMQAQEQAGQMMAEAMKAVPGMGGDAPAFAALSPDTAELARSGQAMSDLWTAATGLSRTMSAALGSAGKAADPTVDATLRAVADPRTWLASGGLASMGGMDGVAGKIAEGPQLADLWNTERQQARVVQAWLEVRRRGLEHNAVVLGAWLRAGQAFTEELGGRTRAGGRMPDQKALLALWTETANRVLLETQRSEPFLKTQAAMIRAGTELRLAQQQVAEGWAKSFGLPTRTELDDVHRTVTDLRRELRALKRQGRPAPAAALGVRRTPRKEAKP